ncbi:MAG: undecaprenyldiphospho-muramoylpentapeptide beta-N-acetylglucosaminyltransferase [Firmicutes bacterium]|nr:undecaprenyldiphospho-muramoylpentapeptide beta-N-acetylglucosaminyltransferase [Bacillota bacterium]
MRVLLTGGGTGGHIYPALTLAAELKKGNHSLLYVGTAGGLEQELVPRAGLPLRTISVSGLERRISFRNILAFFRLGKGLFQAYQILREFRPSVVVGTGGYVSVPVVFTASLLKIPTLIHEQNALPGLANRFLSRFVRVVAVTYEESQSYFPQARRLVVTGNPVREEVLNLTRDEGRMRLNVEEGKQLLLIFGGSRGARPINEAVLAALPILREQRDLFIYFITGKGDYERIRQRLGLGIGKEKMGNIIIKPYLHDMPAGLAAADLVVARAGATTLAELTARGIPAILIPSPYVTGNHQEKNARLLERQGAALVMPENELTGSSLGQKVLKILQTPQLQRQMGKNSYSLGKREAGEALLALICKLNPGE